MPRECWAFLLSGTKKGSQIDHFCIMCCTGVSCSFGVGANATKKNLGAWVLVHVSYLGEGSGEERRRIWEQRRVCCFRTGT